MIICLCLTTYFNLCVLFLAESFRISGKKFLFPTDNQKQQLIINSLSAIVYLLAFVKLQDSLQQGRRVMALALFVLILFSYIPSFDL